jgi:hypothetical protein
VLALLTLDGRERAGAELAALRAADLGFSLDRAPYALRLPWPGEPIRGWIAELGAAAAAAADGAEPLAEIAAGGASWRAGLGAPRAGAGDDAFALGDPAAGYRAMAAIEPGDDPVAIATRDAAAALVAAADAAGAPQEALIAFVAQGLLTRLAAAGLRARAEAALARQTFWPDPITERHWRDLRDDLGRARTPTEVDLVAFHATACLAVESDWNLIRHGALIAPLVAALGHDLEPDPIRARGVRYAATASHALTGLGPRAALAHPVVGGLLGRDTGGQGTEEGEAGYELVTASRTWSEVTGEPADIAALNRVLDRAQAPEPPAAPRPVTRWGSAEGLRPPLPGSLP